MFYYDLCIGKLNESVLPAIAITEPFPVESESAMLALTAQKGDVAIRSDINKTFILKASPATTLANWVELRTPTDSVLSVNGKTGAVTLAKGDVGLGNADNTADSAKSVLSATKLTTARTINGVSFNGTANITVTDDTKEPAVTGGTVTQFWSGTKTWRDLATDIRAAVLTGLTTATNAAITASDTILAAFGKLQAQINAKLGTGNIKAGSNVTVSVNGNDVTVNATVPVTKVAGKTGEVTLAKGDVGLGNVTNESKATMLASAALTGTPTAPTAAAGTNTTQIATTAFVKSQNYLDANSVIDGGTF